MGYKCQFEGNLLPLFGDSEKEWPNLLRLVLYLLGLAWTFLGIAIVSDIFMAAIEKITSLKRRVTDKKTGRVITVFVWNATVSNLTLMALGSSAPEILLSVIEVLGNGMFVGDLGAGTIVGSAAFNLLIISAVCVSAFPNEEVRRIKNISVYIITASCSVFAYLWTLFILRYSSPNVAETWEAVLTLAFCPILVSLAYLADKGYIRFASESEDQVESLQKQPIPDNITMDELAHIEMQIKQAYGAHLKPDEVTTIMAQKYFHQRSRAYYRMAAMHKTVNGKKLSQLTAVAPPSLTVISPIETCDSIQEERQDRLVSVGFQCSRYAFLESCGHAQLMLLRTGPKHVRVSVKYKTRDGTAKSYEDYIPAEGTIIFEKEETEKLLSIEVVDDNIYEENEEFYVELSDPIVEDKDSTNYQAQLSSTPSVMVVIIDDDDPGFIRFRDEEVVVEEQPEPTHAEVVIERHGGASGKISCKYHTEDMNAVASVDYEERNGVIDMAETVQSVSVFIEIKPQGRFDRTSSFLVRLTDPIGCVFDKDTDGGENACICHVKIQGKRGESRIDVLNRMSSVISSHSALLGHRRWKQQFYDAIFQVVEPDEDEEDGEEETAPTVLDYFMHGVSLPWKLLFAFIPPTDYLGGWACFVGSLFMIAVVTALVGDVANLVGCCLDIEPEITAITFVALGTSLPDTFASRTAALMDPYADASIGNITGSNSVNVFIGLGLSWSIAAFYWESQEPSTKWLDKLSSGGIYSDVRDDVRSVMRNGNAVFVVPQGSMWFNLMVFSCNAFFAIQHLWARRRRFRGELGGPRYGFMGQYFSATFLCLQWLIYVGASSIYATVNAKDRTD